MKRALLICVVFSILIAVSGCLSSEKPDQTVNEIIGNESAGMYRISFDTPGNVSTYESNPPYPINGISLVTKDETGNIVKVAIVPAGYFKYMSQAARDEMMQSWMNLMTFYPGSIIKTVSNTIVDGRPGILMIKSDVMNSLTTGVAAGYYLSDTTVVIIAVCNSEGLAAEWIDMPISTIHVEQV